MVAIVLVELRLILVHVINNVLVNLVIVHVKLIVLVILFVIGIVARMSHIQQRLVRQTADHIQQV